MSFVFNGVSSDTMKFNVTSRQVYNAPAYDLNAIEVPGRSGDLLNPQNRFKNKQVTYTGFLKASDFEGSTWREKLSTGLIQLKGWLCSDAGQYHELADDYDPGFTRYGYISGETAISDIEDRPFGVTLTVTFNCKPFMYKAGEPMELPEVKTVGPAAIASFSDGAQDAPLKSLVINIEPVQSGSGDPSPTNIRPISGWSEVDGWKSGVNMLTKVLPNALSLVNNHAKVISDVGTTAVFYAKKGQTYRVSGATGRNRSLIAYYDADPVVDSLSNSVYQSPTQDTADGFTFTAQQSAYCACYLANSVLSDVNIQVETGSTATAYTAPTITPITIPLNQTVYGGTLDVVRGKLVIDRAMVTVDGSQPLSGNGALSYGGHQVVMTPSPAKKPGVVENHDGIISDKFATANAITALDALVVNGRKANGNLYFNMPSDVTTPALARTWFINNPTQVVYELATPIEVDLTPQTIKTLLGTNNIWADAGDTTLEYPLPTESPYPFESRPLYEITMAGTGTLIVNGKEWTITNYTGTLYCDTEAMEWYDASQLRNNIVSGDGWPVFEAGENSVSYTGDITKVMVTPRWRTL